MAWEISFDSVELLEASIDHVVDEIMIRDIAPNLKQAVKRQAEANVYDSYSPQFDSRWGTHSGITDERFMLTFYTRRVLTLVHDVPWQNLGFRHTTGTGTYDNLLDAIEKKGLYHAPPRPYLEEAKDSYVAQEADDDMQSALALYGF